MKALDKDRTRRYETANGFARDIQRYLADEPVEAGPPTAAYRLRKFARKHRTALCAVTAFAALLLVAATVGTYLAVRATAAERLASRRLFEVEKANAATNVALAETKKAKAATDAALATSEESRKQAEVVSAFLTEAFRSPDPSQDGRQVKVADLLDRAVKKLEKEFAGSTAIKGALLHALGTTYLGLGLYDKAVETLKRAGDIRAVALGAAHPDTLASRNDLAEAYRAAGRTAEAIALHEANLKLLESKPGSNPLDALASRINLANAYSSAGRIAEAIALLDPALKLLESKLGPDHPSTLLSRNNLASAYREEGRTAEAIALLETTLKLQEQKLGAVHPDTLLSRYNLAIAYRDAGRTAEAIALLEATLSSCVRRSSGPTTPKRSSAATASLRPTAPPAAPPRRSRSRKRPSSSRNRSWAPTTPKRSPAATSSPTPTSPPAGMPMRPHCLRQRSGCVRRSWAPTIPARS
jgi:tetratricopeptide (TPR) repeat protein